MTSPILWTNETVAAAIGIRAETPFAAHGVCIDSRMIEEKDLFIALTGPNHDGHHYVLQALDRGASAAIVDKVWADSQTLELPLIPVEDPMQALIGLAKWKRYETKAKIIGVTGSVGKTGTKESLALALSSLGETHKTFGNLNNHIGLPLTLARLPDTARFAVLEMGMNHTGEIDILSRLGRPDVAIITTVEAVHLEYFHSVEGIADAKAEIFSGMASNGSGILFRDNPYFDHLSRKARAANVTRLMSFGEHEESDVQLIDCSLQTSCSDVRVKIEDHIFDYRISAPGKHWVLNSLAVLGAVKALGEDPVAASRRFSDIRTQKGRGAYRQIMLRDGKTAGMFDESYNASPASVRAAIAVLGKAALNEGARRIAVLGDMLELGESGPDLHAALAEDLIRARIDKVYCCGPLMKFLWDSLPVPLRGGYAQTSTDLAPHVCQDICADDMVTVKGSLGSNMTSIVQALEAIASSAQPENTESNRGKT